MSEVLLSDELRHDELERGCVNTSVSFIGDFNYSILEHVKVEDPKGFNAFTNFIFTTS